MIELSVENLHLSYGDNPVLKGLSMTLKKGEVVSLLGPSGCGKTTLLRAVAGLEEAQSGKIMIGSNTVFDGESKIDLPAENRNLGLVFQSYALWPHLTVYDNVAYPLQLRNLNKEEIAQKVQLVLKELGLAHLSKRFPHALSGGQQQRVAIARSLVYNPPVLLLDEPLSNLDAKMREEARVFLRELIIDFGLSALMVTHDQAEAMAISDRILLLNNGTIAQEGTPEMMYGEPETLFTAEFMGSNNRLVGNVLEIQGEYVLIETKLLKIWGRASKSALASLSVGDLSTAVIRVERVKISDDSAAENVMTLPHVTTMYLGDKFETLFRDGDAKRDVSNITHPMDLPISIRMFTSQTVSSGVYHLHLPKEDVWIYPQ
ncbi:ABC transporter ATP-binding protein [Thorsellia anophelis]|uniref:Iron(III) transport system ATP-binding protein n=1 Tax=Thorsellia anophelis DSM 18579 TaxID=1123402 RepID=A0A1I0AHI6_9GAMM|nr:ABC transporter ATP-binding protein [Thorsellia anophelis]SES92727.1 iron(III) transport system ATP-binding protein [Thorsellia anophelis DSM 18579]